MVAEDAFTKKLEKDVGKRDSTVQTQLMYLRDSRMITGHDYGFPPSRSARRFQALFPGGRGILCLQPAPYSNRGVFVSGQDPQVFVDWRSF